MDNDDFLPTCSKYKELLERYVIKTGTPIDEARDIVGLWTIKDFKEFFGTEAF